MRTSILVLALSLLAACTPYRTEDGQGPEPQGAGEVVEGSQPVHGEAEDDPSPAAADGAAAPAADPGPATEAPDESMTTSTEKATFGAGCFWCVEAVLEQLEGVEDVVSGYMGGGPVRPTYKQVCTGTTDFVEVVQVTFDPAVIPYDELLDWFWRLHDPTTLNRQGNDVGPQYRSVIFTHSDAQREAAERSLAAADASGAFLRPIVTAIEPADVFHEAEDYHQDYYRGNKAQGYCRMVIAPKLNKLGLED